LLLFGTQAPKVTWPGSLSLLTGRSLKQAAALLSVSINTVTARCSAAKSPRFGGAFFGGRNAPL
jgi:hypothetical protein